MHAVANGAQSVGVTDSERAQKIRERLDALGISDREFEATTGVDRKALRRAASGEPVRRSTYVAIETWLDRIEHEVGMDAPPPLPAGARRIGDPADDLVEFTVEGALGVRAVVKGPIRDLAALQEAVSKLIAGMQAEQNIRPPDET